MNKTIIKAEVWDNVANNEVLTALIALNAHCISIKIDKHCSPNHIENIDIICIPSYDKYLHIEQLLIDSGTTHKLARIIVNILGIWYDECYFSFTDDEVIQINI